MSKDFLGIGWRFPVGTEIDTRVATSAYEQDIKEAIIIILSTAKGERLMRPTFGCGIHDYVFSVINRLNLNHIENEIREALMLWEPRVDVIGVTSDVSEAANGRVDINIEYEVRATNARFNLVYPFYLTEGD